MLREATECVFAALNVQKKNHIVSQLQSEIGVFRREAGKSVSLQLEVSTSYGCRYTAVLPWTRGWTPVTESFSSLKTNMLLDSLFWTLLLPARKHISEDPIPTWAVICHYVTGLDRPWHAISFVYSGEDLLTGWFTATTTLSSSVIWYLQTDPIILFSKALSWLSRTTAGFLLSRLNTIRQHGSQFHSLLLECEKESLHKRFLYRISTI